MQLHPQYVANRDYHLSVGDGHQIHVQEYGASTGIAVVLCHGGPGAGLCPENCRFFDLERYRVIMFSQRGCGHSTPHDINTNTTLDLVADLEFLRQQLGIEKWLVCGESWGATLALVYAIKHREHIAGLILRASFLACNSDFEWLYTTKGAGAHFYPECFKEFAHDFTDWHALLDFYQQQLNSSDQIKASKFAKLWCHWEQVLCHGEPLTNWSLQEPHVGLNQARLMVHYFRNLCFIEEGYIAENAHVLTHLPIWFVHGRADLICRYSAVQQLAEQLNAQLLILDGIGHSSDNQVYLAAMRRAADLMYIKLSRDQCKV